MAQKPGYSPAEEQATDASREPQASPEGIGPLAIDRHVKDDGRALILYTRAVRERP